MSNRFFLVLSLLSMLDHIKMVNADQGLSLRGATAKEHMTIRVPDDAVLVAPRCFETTQELRDAVHSYEGKNHINSTLVDLYGWPISNWCVSGITDFSNLFARKTKFNEPLHQWDMSNAKTISGMFMDAWSFDQDLSTWDVSSVTDFSRAFAGARSFQGRGLTEWNTWNAQSLAYMFMHAHSFHQPDIVENWNIRNVTHMEKMFEDCRSMRGYDLGAAWPLLHEQKGEVLSFELSNVMDNSGSLRSASCHHPLQS